MLHPPFLYLHSFLRCSAVTLQMGDRIPRWLDHLTRNSVFDGDNVFLHMLERKLARESAAEGGSWRSSYFMPAQSDRWDAALASGVGIRAQSAVKAIPGAPAPFCWRRATGGAPPQPLSCLAVVEARHPHYALGTGA